jgi:hypothetical protein
VVHQLVKSEVPPYCGAAQLLAGGQGARMVGISLGLPEMLWKYCLMRNQVTLIEVGELRLYFIPVVPDELILKILGPEQ